MKPPYSTLLPLLFLTGNVSHAATTVFSEDFTYANGSLAGLNGGTGFTGAWGAGDFTVNNNAGFSNPNATTQNSTQNRLFTGFSENSFVLSFDYNILANTEGSYDFHVVLLDSNGQEILSVGNRNNQGPTGEYYVIRLGAGGGFQSSVLLGATETYNDTVTISGSFTGADLSAGVDSTAFNALDANLARTLTNPIDFSTGGTLRIEKIALDGMQISVDNFLLTVPEPSSALLLGLGGTALVLRRRK